MKGEIGVRGREIGKERGRRMEWGKSEGEKKKRNKIQERKTEQTSYKVNTRETERKVEETCLEVYIKLFRGIRQESDVGLPEK